MVNATYSYGGKSAAIAAGKAGIVSSKAAGMIVGAGNTSGETFADKLNKTADSYKDAANTDAGKPEKSQNVEVSQKEPASKEVSSKESVSEDDVKENVLDKTSYAEDNGEKPGMDDEELKRFISDFVDMLNFMAQFLNMPTEQFVNTLNSIDISPEEILTEEGVKKVILTVNNGKDDLEFLLNPELAKQLKDVIGFLGNFSEEELAYIRKALQDNDDNGKGTVWNQVLDAFDSEVSGEVSDEKVPYIDENAHGVRDDNTYAAVVKSDNLENVENVNDKNTDNASTDSKESGKHRSSEKGMPDVNRNMGFVENIRTSVVEALGSDVAPESAESIMRQIIDRIGVTSKEDLTSIEISLTPESLGKVQINVVSKDGAVTAQISVETEAAKKAVESQIATLRETLNVRDIKVDAVEVTVASHQYESNNSNDGRGSREQVKKNVRRTNPGKGFLDDDTEDIQPEPGVSNDDRMMLMGSTVSYSA